jgi:L-serine dehydratase
MGEVYIIEAVAMNKTPFVSIFNDVLGPVMRGPSSSHTAGSYHIGLVSRSLLGREPVAASFTFDPQGSYAKTFREQNADKAFAAGIMGWRLTDGRFSQALEFAGKTGLRLAFKVARLARPDHPNAVVIEMKGRSGSRLEATAHSTGGGGILFVRLDGWPVAIDGKSHELFIWTESRIGARVKRWLESKRLGWPIREARGEKDVLLSVRSREAVGPALQAELGKNPGVKKIRMVLPVFYAQKGHPLFSSSSEMVRFAERHRLSLGQAALAYESKLLGLSREEAMAEMTRRCRIMRTAVKLGLQDETVGMKLLPPSARKIMTSEKRGKVALGGIHTRAAAKAMAALHTSNSGGIVCAAPTGGSAGVIPGVIDTLVAECGLKSQQACLVLFAAGAIGLMISLRATFAAEVAGCQVEIGAAGAMAAASVVEAAGGKAASAADAAAIALQNTMGSVCDLVQGICEIPCHTRNAVAASSAFICADLILGGYKNPVPLDETIDAVYASGKMLPPELRCTALGGLAVAPSARALKRRT